LVVRPNREDAWQLLNEHVTTDSLIKRALAVEAAMRYHAALFGEDQELWGATGLIHDFDYEEHPTADEHPLAGVAILEERGWPTEVIEAVMGHATYLNVPRVTLMSKTLFAVDELTGLVSAAALVRPSKSVLDLETSSVTKKWKDKAFARGVNRADIELGMQELGVERAEHIARVVAAMRQVAAELDLVGTLS
jgi:putative nucleotidyltransferase with HDIG domain